MGCLLYYSIALFYYPFFNIWPLCPFDLCPFDLCPFDLYPFPFDPGLADPDPPAL